MRLPDARADFPAGIGGTVSKGKKNAYRCQKCGLVIVTEDIDEGVTPFTLRCRATKGCEGRMESMFYRIPQELVAHFEWYRPDSEESLTLPQSALTHVGLGGLLLRPRAPAITDHD